MKFSNVFLVLMLMLTFGCNKYEDGPVISLHSKNDRIAGNKKITLYEVNGIDSTSMIEAAFANTSYDSTGFEWILDLEERSILCIHCISGYWNFQNEKQEIRLSMPMPLFSREIFPIGNWTILRLTEKDFWLTILDGGKTYVLRLVRI